jgi:hypothetical protein
MTLKRRITVFLIAGLVLAAVAAVYYMPHWQQTVAAVSKGGRRGGPPATEPVPVLATAARAADVPVYLDGVGTAKALNTVTVRSQVDGKIINISFTEGQDVDDAARAVRESRRGALRGAAARWHHPHRDIAAGRADVVPAGNDALPGAICALSGDCQSVSGARRRMAAGPGRGRAVERPRVNAETPPMRTT